MGSKLGTELPDQLCELLIPWLEERLPSRGCDFAVICPAGDEDCVKMGEVDLALWRDFSDILL